MCINKKNYRFRLFSNFFFSHLCQEWLTSEDLSLIKRQKQFKCWFGAKYDIKYWQPQNIGHSLEEQKNRHCSFKWKPAGKRTRDDPATQISRVLMPFFTFYKTQPFYTDKERVSERKSFNYGCFGIVTVFSPFLKDRYMLLKKQREWTSAF